MFKIPIVATNWRGIPSVGVDGVCDFLVPIRDPEAVADKLQVLISDPPLRRKMAEPGRRRYLDQFTLESYHQNLRCLIERLPS